MHHTTPVWQQAYGLALAAAEREGIAAPEIVERRSQAIFGEGWTTVRGALCTGDVAMGVRSLQGWPETEAASLTAAHEALHGERGRAAALDRITRLDLAGAERALEGAGEADLRALIWALRGELAAARQAARQASIHRSLRWAGGRMGLLHALEGRGATPGHMALLDGGAFQRALTEELADHLDAARDRLDDFVAAQFVAVGAWRVKRIRGLYDLIGHGQQWVGAARRLLRRDPGAGSDLQRPQILEDLVAVDALERRLLRCHDAAARQIDEALRRAVIQARARGHRGEDRQGWIRRLQQIARDPDVEISAEARRRLRGAVRATASVLTAGPAAHSDLMPRAPARRIIRDAAGFCAEVWHPLVSEAPWISRGTARAAFSQGLQGAFEGLRDPDGPLLDGLRRQQAVAVELLDLISQQLTPDPVA